MILLVCLAAANMVVGWRQVAIRVVAESRINDDPFRIESKAPGNDIFQENKCICVVVVVWI